MSVLLSILWTIKVNKYIGMTLNVNQKTIKEKEKNLFYYLKGSKKKKVKTLNILK